MRKTIFGIILLSVCILILFFGSFQNTSSVFSFNDKTVIIDAGHGLPDGGAVAKDGTIESEINLSIAKLLESKLTKAGFTCIMIRSDENSIYSEGETIHAKKVSDIRNRVKIANDNKDAFVISIHMNTYPDSKVSGTQIFYRRDSDFSKNVAEEIQNAINLQFQPNNQKTIKPISSNIYFLNHIKNDCILAECGFLTNPDDLERLKTFEFQEEFSTTLAEAIIFKFSGSDKNVN